MDSYSETIYYYFTHIQETKYANYHLQLLKKEKGRADIKWQSYPTAERAEN